MNCIQCGNGLIAPEWSEYRNERRVHHVWRCCKCAACFETIADTRSIKEFTTGDIFPSLAVE
jgi:hypothetical protein